MVRYCSHKTRRATSPPIEPLIARHPDYIHMIPYSRQDISEEDIAKVVSVLRSDYLTSGEWVPAFEDTVRDLVGSSYGVAFNSATSALHGACAALGLAQGDHLWTSPNSFVASANCGLYCGATIDFVDIDLITYNISISALEEKLEYAAHHGLLPKVLVVVHFAGQSCDMESIFKLSKRYGFKIIEDASHAIGGKYADTYIGNCQYSDVTIFSFHPVKIITSGEGGMAMTKRSAIHEKLKNFRSHGIEREPSKFALRAENELWGYQQTSLGFNYRMTDIQAALGVSQMNRLDEFVRLRNNIATTYFEQLKDLPITLPFQAKNILSSFHLFPILIDEHETGISQQAVFDKLRRGGIGVNLHYIPIYRQPFYERLGFKENYCPNAETYFRRTISIPIFPSMTEETQYEVITKLSHIILESKH